MARRRGGGSGRKADLKWLNASASFTAQAAGSSALAIVSSGTASQTIMRTRGHLLAYIDGASAPAKLVRLGCGLIIAQSGQGATVLSSPVTDGDAPWFWYETFCLGYEEGVVDTLEYAGVSVVRIPIDTKAMRVLRPNQEVQAVVENVTVGNASAVNICIDIRMLFAD